MATKTTTKTNKRAGGEKRGNSRDRARSRQNLLVHFGDGLTCRCVYCDTDLVDDYGQDNHIERDRIAEGESYRMTNLVPACRTCNLDRLDLDIMEYAEKIGRVDHIQKMVDHAKSYKPRRVKR